MLKPYLIFLCFLISFSSFSQSKNSDQELLATFGSMAELSCGDDDFSQVVFFAIPKRYKDDFYFRVFDPDCGGKYDKSIGHWETNTIFEFYGGKGCFSEIDARQTQPIGNYKSGKNIGRGIFARESELDGKWISFGPYRTLQGEEMEEFPGYVFLKLVVEGRTGNDGNVYSLAISKSKNKNIYIEHASIFEYETTYISEGKVLISRFNEDLLSEFELKIPISLSPLDNEPDYTIIAEPIDE
jgi:hypothetical protein